MIKALDAPMVFIIAISLLFSVTSMDKLATSENKATTTNKHKKIENTLFASQGFLTKVDAIDSCHDIEFRVMIG